MKKTLILILLVLTLCLGCSKEYRKVTYNILDEVYLEVEVEYNTLAKKPDDPIKEGYTFDGWFKDSTTTLPFDFETNYITNNITLYSKWIANNYEITLYDNVSSTPIVINRLHDELLNVDDPVKEGYTFMGWYKDENFNDLWNNSNVITNNMSLYAKFDINPYEITLVIDNEIKNVYVTPNGLLNVEEPIKEGYTFIGWYLENEVFDLNTLITSDLRLEAKFKKHDVDLSTLDENTLNLLSLDGFVDGKITDFSMYYNTNYYRKVSNAYELSLALKDAKYEYTTTYEETTNSCNQELIKEGSVRVIEITNDINLGYNVISDEAKSNGIIVDYKTSSALSDMVLTNGISQVKVENVSNLLIYSKNGSKLTHAGFKVTSCHNVVFRNIKMDEIWEWEDSFDKSISKIGDYDKFGWAYFKISHCGQIWIDHMEFGKSYDGQIDYSNPVSNSKSTKIRLAYGSDGSNGLHISYCKFNAGSDDKSGYLYKMMENIENLYINNESNYLYYNALRDAGLSFEEILYGIAIPQKKGFLFGDNAEEKDDFYYNQEMKVSFNSCEIINFCDRIPKVRGGQVYMYNTIIDSLEYMDYRSRVYAYGGAVSQVNSSWKCASVSQGFIVSYNGYLHVENTIIKGVETIIKNNDTKVNPFVENIGYYNFVNVSYQQQRNHDIITGSTNESYVPNQFNKQSSNLKISKVLWPYYNGNLPFSVYLVSLEDLKTHLNNEDYGVGVKNHITSWLISNLKG